MGIDRPIEELIEDINQRLEALHHAISKIEANQREIWKLVRDLHDQLVKP